MAAGRLVMEKQFTKLVHAFADVADELPDWRLRIFGQGHQRPHLIRETRKRGLWDRVELPGNTTEMRGEWAKASICALSSRAEGYPLVLQEAMAAGVPCVSFDCASGPREIVQHEVNGLLVAPESIAGLSAALLRLGTDADLRQRLGAAALQTSRQWDADALAERWVGIFADARARRAGRARFAFRAAASAAPTPPAAPVADLSGVTPAQARHEALGAGGGGRREGHRPSGWSSRRTRPASPWWCCRSTPAPRSSRRWRPPTCRRTSRCATRRPTAGTSGAAPVADLAKDLLRGRTSVVALEPWPTDGMRGNRVSHSLVGQGCTVEVEFWEAGVDGHLVAPRANRYTQRLPRGAETVTARGRGRHRPHPAADGAAERPRVRRSRSTPSTPGSTATTRRGTRPGATGWPR